MFSKGIHIAFGTWLGKNRVVRSTTLQSSAIKDGFPKGLICFNHYLNSNTETNMIISEYFAGLLDEILIEGKMINKRIFWAAYSLPLLTPLLVLTAFCIFSTLPSASQAQEIVYFESTPAPISPFRIKKAKAMGIELAPAEGIELTAHLFRPSSDTPSPAVIMLLSADGLQPSHLSWGKSLSDWGYVALVIDSFGSRGGTNFRDTPSVGMPADAIDGVRYLKSLDFVKADNIALLGFSMGGSRLFSILGKSGENRSLNKEFKAGIAFYPNCVTDKKLQVPLLILGGEKDELMSISNCRRTEDNAENLSNNITFVTYPDATHFFDNPNYSKDEIAKTKRNSEPLHFATNHYDLKAHEASKQQVRQFLFDHIGK